MGAKDTVMSPEEIEEVSSMSRYDKYSFRKVAEAQAEISFKVGKTEGVAESLLPALKAIEDSRKAGQKEERDSWLLKTDPEKARDSFTKDIIERSYAQGIREVMELIPRLLKAAKAGECPDPDCAICKEKHSIIKKVEAKLKEENEKC